MSGGEAFSCQPGSDSLGRGPESKEWNVDTPGVHSGRESKAIRREHFSRLARPTWKGVLEYVTESLTSRNGTAFLCWGIWEPEGTLACKAAPVGSCLMLMSREAHEEEPQGTSPGRVPLPATGLSDSSCFLRLHSDREGGDRYGSSRAWRTQEPAASALKASLSKGGSHCARPPIPVTPANPDASG